MDEGCNVCCLYIKNHFVVCFEEYFVLQFHDFKNMIKFIIKMIVYLKTILIISKSKSIFRTFNFFHK